MNDKNKQIEDYVKKVSKRLNKRYKGAISDEKIEMVVQMFCDSKEDIKKIKKQIDELAKKVEKDHKNRIRRNSKTKNKYINQLDSKKETKSYEEIYITIKILKDIIDKNKLKLYISGGVVPYLLLDKYSNRLHDDIDIICDLKNMNKVREVFKKEKYYKYDFDSINYAPDGKDYGFSMVINGVSVGIYPFTYKNKELTQYTYDSYLRFCKIKKMKLEKLSDYVTSYKSKNRKTYDTMSLEYIKLTKLHAGRSKDKEDLLTLDQLNVNKDIFKRINMYKEIQNTSVEDLEYDNEHKLDRKTDSLKRLISIANKGKEIQKIDNKKKKLTIFKKKKVKKM